MEEKVRRLTIGAIAYIFVTVTFQTVHGETLPDEGAEFCDFDENDDAQRDDAETEPSFCQEVILNDNPSLYNQDDHNILAALATSVLNKTYPSRVNSMRSFAVFDEMPYPVPTGASSFFMVLITVIFTWYFNKFIHWLLKGTAKTLDLFPMTDQFPKVYLYMLQQSRRESHLSRDVRNTWSWLATFYLLKPSDALINTEEIFRFSGWTDFQVPHDVWGIIKAVLRVNAADTTEVNNAFKQTRKVASESNAVSDKNLVTAHESKRRLSADELGQLENNRLLMLRQMLETSFPSLPEGSENGLTSMRDEAASLSLRPTINASNFDVENQKMSR